LQGVVVVVKRMAVAAAQVDTAPLLEPAVVVVLLNLNYLLPLALRTRLLLGQAGMEESLLLIREQIQQTATILY
jgi:hypothetical protein